MVFNTFPTITNTIWLVFSKWIYVLWVDYTYLKAMLDCTIQHTQES